MISGFGMFNALVMSYSRLPLAMAQDGMLPKFFGKLHPKSKAPWVTIVVLACFWMPCLLLGFERLVTLDILVYGSSLSLEFVALAVLRFTEPNLKRPFKVPGGLFGSDRVGIPPMLLLGFSVFRSETASPLLSTLKSSKLLSSALTSNSRGPMGLTLLTSSVPGEDGAPQLDEGRAVRDEEGYPEPPVESLGVGPGGPVPAVHQHPDLALRRGIDLDLEVLQPVHPRVHPPNQRTHLRKVPSLPEKLLGDGGDCGLCGPDFAHDLDGQPFRIALHRSLELRGRR